MRRLFGRRVATYLVAPPEMPKSTMVGIAKIFRRAFQCSCTVKPQKKHTKTNSTKKRIESETNTKGSSKGSSCLNFVFSGDQRLKINQVLVGLSPSPPPHLPTASPPTSSDDKRSKSKKQKQQVRLCIVLKKRRERRTVRRAERRARHRCVCWPSTPSDCWKREKSRQRAFIAKLNQFE